MAATTTPLPTPPFVDVPGLPNFRDCGGYPVAASSGGDNGGGKAQKIIRRGILFRSSEPSMLTEGGIAILRDTLGITHVFDLRSKPEIERDAVTDGRQPREWDGARRVFAPVFLDEDYSPQAVAERYSHFSSAAGEVSRHGWGLLALLVSSLFFSSLAYLDRRGWLCTCGFIWFGVRLLGI